MSVCHAASGAGPDAHQRDLRGAVRDGCHEFGEVEAQRRRDVHVEVGVVRGVRAVEQRDAVQRDVPQVEAVVHADDCERALEQARQAQRGQQAEAAAVHPARERGHDGPLSERDRRRRGAGDAEVAQRVRRRRLDAVAERLAPFGPLEQAERADGERAAQNRNEEAACAPGHSEGGQEGRDERPRRWRSALRASGTTSGSEASDARLAVWQ